MHFDRNVTQSAINWSSVTSLVTYKTKLQRNNNQQNNNNNIDVTSGGTSGEVNWLR